MTPEFEKWAYAQEQNRDKYSRFTIPEDAHFWLTLIFAEIEREAAKPYENSRGWKLVVGIEHAFEAVKSKFGLGGE